MDVSSSLHLDADRNATDHRHHSATDTELDSSDGQENGAVQGQRRMRIGLEAQADGFGGAGGFDERRRRMD